jgi:hypothetical protein
MLQTPGLIVSLLLASIYAVAFHLWKGRSLRDLLFYWLAAVVGFASGQVAGYLLNILPWTIGQVHIVEATFVALLLLFIAHWLRQEKNLESNNE